MFGESDNDALEGKPKDNPHKLAQVLFRVISSRMVDYSREFEAKQHIE
jgi:hypothetical protein